MSGMVGGVHELQILRDEFEIDETAGGKFQIPAVAVAFFGGDGAPHLDHVAGYRRGVAPAAERGADDVSTRLLELRRRRRNDARSRQRQMLPGPGFVFLIALESSELRRDRSGAA